MTLDQLTNLITNSTEIFGAGIAFLSLVFAGVQVYLLIKTLEVAEKFLPQHEDKIRLEMRLKLIKDTMAMVISFQRLYGKIFQIDGELVDELRYGRRSNLIIREKILNSYKEGMARYPEADTLFFDIDLHIKLLKSENLIKINIDYKNAFLKYKLIFENLEKSNYGENNLTNYIINMPLRPFPIYGEIASQFGNSYNNLMSSLLIEFEKKVE